MKVTERVLEHRIRQQIDDMQFGLMNGKRTIDALFVVRNMQEKFSVRRIED